MCLCVGVCVCFATVPHHQLYARYIYGLITKDTCAISIIVVLLIKVLIMCSCICHSALTLHYTALYHITLHYTTLRYITLLYITLPAQR